MTGWRLALRLAWRDALRARGRSLLAMVIIALPVLAVTAADILIATEEVSAAEGVERRIGAADAEVSFVGRNVRQAPDPNDAIGWQPTKAPAEAAQLATIREVLGPDAEAVQRREKWIGFRTDKGVTTGHATEVDLREPVADGLYRLESGRLPENTDEAVVTQALADRGPGPGEMLELRQGTRLRVVGIVESTTYTDEPEAVTLVGGFGLGDGGRHSIDRPGWLVEAGAPVTWEQVGELNRQGAMVTSAHVLRHPPSLEDLGAEGGIDDGGDDGMLQAVALIVVMALIEVVLLAGPSFAVGARRHQRNLALIGVSGGTPRQMRRVILASAVVLGGAAAVAGVVLGILAARLLVPVVQGFSGEWFGPFEIPWWHVAGIVGFGVVSAVLAALVPAWIASRQDVVAVLNGRRGDRRPSLRSPLLGLVLLGVGIAGSVAGARRSLNAEIAIAAFAVPTVLGMVLLVPVVVVAVSRLARFLPLSLRFALRDATRHRTRTVPAIAAVAATVAGTVALGISVTSDQEERRATYQPVLAIGDARVSADRASERKWREVVAAVEAQADGHQVVVTRGVHESRDWYDVMGPRGDGLLSSYTGTFGSSILVGDSMPGVDLGLTPEQMQEGDAMLRSGGAVVLTHQEVAGDRARFRVHSVDRERGRSNVVHNESTPALFLQVRHETARAQAVVPVSFGKRLGDVRTVAAHVEGPVSEALEKDIEEAVSAVSPAASVFVERGYQEEDEYLIVLWVLVGLSAVLMLGGTLTATFLALSDARPDLATLGAVGAAPRVRRSVAAAYALLVGLLGAVLGAATGFVPGIAVTYPLTSYGGAGGPYLDVPWALVAGVVVCLPVLTALVVALFARSRLPMVARLD